jgi:N-sulfoglucosamine sulfohydrolase
MMPLFLQMRKKNQLNEIENKWFQTKTKEELYDCIKDPHNINNLAEKPEYQTDLAGMRTILEAHLKDRKDYGLISESKMIQEMWPNFEQQITINPIIQTDNNKTTISSKTKGTSIGYIISKNANEKLDLNSKWQLYHQPLTVQKGKTIYTIAQRIGFKESDITSHKIN